jgi:hypothetical protein
MPAYNITGVLHQTLDLIMFYHKLHILGMLLPLIDSTNQIPSSTVGTTLSIGTTQTNLDISSIIIILLGLGVLYVGYLLDRELSQDQHPEDHE